MAGAVRFELTLTVLETVALPLNYTPIWPPWRDFNSHIQVRSLTVYPLA